MLTDDDASLKPTLKDLAQKRLPLILPWHPEQTIYPGQLFHSRRASTDDPWSKRSPFVPESLSSTPIRFERCDGGVGSFRSVATQATVQNDEHMALGLKVEVDLVVVTASAAGRYDKDISENDDQTKISVRSSFRYGTVTLDHIPTLSNEALIQIKYGGGLEAFEETYGDYYVLGYHLGGDNALLLSSHSHATSTKEVFELAAKVETLLGDVSYNKQMEEHSSSSSFSISMFGYDTLANENWNMPNPPPPPPVNPWLAFYGIQGQTRSEPGPRYSADEMREEGRRVRKMAQNLSRRVEEKMGRHISPQARDATLSYDVCDRIVKECLVVEIILVPVSTMRQVQPWALSTDVI